jgi:hypothetical protein
MKPITITALLLAVPSVAIWTFYHSSPPSETVTPKQVARVQSALAQEPPPQKKERKNNRSSYSEALGNPIDENGVRAQRQPTEILDLDLDKIKVPPHVDKESAQKILDMMKKLQEKRANDKTEPYVDGATSQEQAGRSLARYFKTWDKEEENPATSEQGRKWLLEEFGKYRVPTDDLEVSCRETLCRIRIILSGAKALDALGRFPIKDRRVITGNPEWIDDQFHVVVYHPIEDGKLERQD